MEKLATVLETLAAKLGVATEVLWKALIVQAKLDAIASLFQYALIIGVTCFLIVKTKKVVDGVNGGTDNPFGIVVIGVGWFIATLLLVAMFFSIPETIAGFMNPEFWAMNRVLKLMNPK